MHELTSLSGVRREEGSQDVEPLLLLRFSLLFLSHGLFRVLRHAASASLLRHELLHAPLPDGSQFRIVRHTCAPCLGSFLFHFIALPLSLSPSLPPALLLFTRCIDVRQWFSM